MYRNVKEAEYLNLALLNYDNNIEEKQNTGARFKKNGRYSALACARYRGISCDQGRG